MVIFGANGDLTKRKLIPALYRLAYERRLPASFAVIGNSRTDMTDDAATQVGLTAAELRQRNVEVTPVRRVGDPADVAATAAYLGSDEAGYVTGQTVYVDGGRTLG